VPVITLLQLITFYRVGNVPTLVHHQIALDVVAIAYLVSLLSATLLFTGYIL